MTLMGRDDRVFRHLLKDKKNLVGAEIGVYHGEHAKLLLDNLDIKKFYLVDLYKDYDELNTKWNKNYDEAEMIAKKLLKNEPVKWLIGWSHHMCKKVKDESLDFCYIDANHEYEWFNQDFSRWLPKVKRGGLFGGHDYAQREGVTRLINHYIVTEKYPIEIDGIEWYFWKP